MKKVLLVFVVLISLSTLVGCKKVEKDDYKDETFDGKIIGTSNPASESKLQIRIINDYINIRKEKSINSDIIGIVKKDSIFDVVDYGHVGDFFWVHIKTDNNLDGYVASYENNIYYNFINGDIDFIAPKLEINVESINVDSYSKITDEYIKSIVTYSDDKDQNPKLTYNVLNEENYYLNIEVIDAGNNSTQKKVRLNVSKERLASNGKWIEYTEIRNLRKKFLNIIQKYGSTEEYTYLVNSYWKMDFNISSTYISVFSDSEWYHGCNYRAIGNNIEIDSCYDSVGSVSYDEFKSKIATQEQSAKKAYLNIVSEFEKTGYKISDLFLNIE
ncbi:MAG: SH3 domain-containing protein [Bacilli bacterium]